MVEEKGIHGSIAVTSDWGLEDPSDVVGEEASIDATFHATLARIEACCQAFFALPFAHLDRSSEQNP